MAEAFGLAASAAGIVSLGLQVFEGVASYVEGIKDRKPELSAISKQANALQAIVKTLQVAAPRIDAILTNNDSPLFSSLKTVEEELWALKLFLSSTQDVSDQSSRIASVLKEQQKKLVYPFHRPTLEKLQKRLESAINALQISLQVVNLTATTSISTTVSEVHTTVNNSQSSLMGIQSGIGSLESSMALMTTSVNPMTQASLGSMEGKLNLLLTEGRTENEQLETNFQAVHTNIGNVSHKVQQTMSMVQMSTGTIHERFQQHSMEIRQLQDLVSRALSQSAAREMEMKEATQAINHKMITLSRHSDDSNAPANSSRPALVLGRLLSKPSELKDAYESDHVVASHVNRRYKFASSTARQICPCQSRTITQYQVKKFGDFYTSRKTAAQSTHLSNCEYQAYDSQVTTNTTTISYTGFRRLLSASLEMSFSWTSGAGGFSISPNITLRPMVDMKKSPVFLLIQLIRCNADELVEMTCVEQRHTTLEQFLNGLVDSILKLYRSKTCSPYDVNKEGQSVLHIWIYLLNALLDVIWGDYGGSKRLIEIFTSASGSSIRRLMSRLSPNGILFDYHGNSPLDKIKPNVCIRLENLIEFREVATEICSYDNEITIRTHEDLKESGNVIDRKTFLFWKSAKVGLPIMAEIMELGLLSKSLMTGDEARLQHILDTDRSVLEEKSFLFQTPFHLAALISSPKPLKALLDAAQDGSTQFDTPDGEGNHALEVAASTSSEICRNGKGWELCTDCACSLSFDMLQSNGWRLGPKTIVSPTRLLYHSSQTVRMKLIMEIKRVREELRAAALQYLSPHECRHLRLDSSRILDGHMQSVVQRLLETGVIIPSEYSDLIEQILRGQSECIYHYLVRNFKDLHTRIKSVRLAELLFDSGFEDMDHENAYGITPLSDLVNRQPIEDKAELVLWFLQHGAQVSRAVPENKCGTTVAHRILRSRNLSRLKRTQYSSTAKVISLVAPLKLSDKCRCACFGSGCTTTTYFFRYLWQVFFTNKSEIDLSYCHEVNTLFQKVRRDLESEFDYKCEDGDKDENSVTEGSWDLSHCNDIDTDDDTSSQRESLGAESSWDSDKGNVRTAFWQSARQSSIFLQLLEVDFVQWDHVSLSALKMFTFEALGIRHTCCHLIHGWHYWSDWLDKPPLCDEEVDEIQEEDHELLCLLDDLVEEFVVKLRTSGDTLQRFLIHYWAPRMEGVLEDLQAARMSPEEVSAAEQVGIIWEEDSASEFEEEQEEEEESCPPSPTLSERFEALIEKMDEIVATATQTDST